MRKMTVIQKISFSALFIALGIILSRFVSLPSLFGLPFLKVSLSPSVVMFSSFYLGPLWGLLVGTFTDVFGALLVPQGGAFNPLFTIPACLTGLMPYILYRIFNNKFEKKFPISLSVILFLISLFLTLYFSLNTTIHSEGGKAYTIEPWLKWTVGIGSFTLSTVFVIGVILIRQKLKNVKLNKFYNIYTVATAILLTYFVFKIPISSVIKSFVLSFDFWFVYVAQCLVGFVACFVHIILVSLILNVTTFFNIRGALVKETNTSGEYIDVETFNKVKEENNEEKKENDDGKQK